MPSGRYASFQISVPWNSRSVAKSETVCGVVQSPPRSRREQMGYDAAKRLKPAAERELAEQQQALQAGHRQELERHQRAEGVEQDRGGAAGGHRGGGVWQAASDGRMPSTCRSPYRRAERACQVH